MQEKVQKSSWNEPYSSSFTKQSRSKMALYRWIKKERRWNKNYYYYYYKIIVSDAIGLFFKTAISILLISNRNSFRVLFDKIASVYFISKNVFIF